MKKLSLLTVALFLVCQFFNQGCSHKKSAPLMTQRFLQSKRVALSEIKGPPEAKSHVEVALINEIIEEGRFEIVDRATVSEAMVIYPTEIDWQGLGKKVGADYVLEVNIAEFNIKERQGYDKIEEEDSVLTEESGEHKAVTGSRMVKVKSYEGQVRLYFKLFDVQRNEFAYQGPGSATLIETNRAEQHSKHGSAKYKFKNQEEEPEFVGKMALLERLTKKATHDFFERIPK